MKKSLFIFLFFIGLLNALSQQKVSIKVFYDKAFKNYTRDTTNKPPSFFKNMDYVLNCNATEARFEIVKKEIPANDLMEYSNNARLGGGNRIYYIDLKTQEH